MFTLNSMKENRASKLVSLFVACLMATWAPLPGHAEEWQNNATAQKTTTQTVEDYEEDKAATNTTGDSVVGTEYQNTLIIDGGDGLAPATVTEEKETVVTAATVTARDTTAVKIANVIDQDKDGAISINDLDTAKLSNISSIDGSTFTGTTVDNQFSVKGEMVDGAVVSLTVTDIATGQAATYDFSRVERTPDGITGGTISSKLLDDSGSPVGAAATFQVILPLDGSLNDTLEIIPATDTNIKSAPADSNNVAQDGGTMPGGMTIEELKQSPHVLKIDTAAVPYFGYAGTDAYLHTEVDGTAVDLNGVKVVYMGAGILENSYDRQYELNPDGTPRVHKVYALSQTEWDGLPSELGTVIGTGLDENGIPTVFFEASALGWGSNNPGAMPDAATDPEGYLQWMNNFAAAGWGTEPPSGPAGQNGRLVGYKVALTSSTIPGIPAGIFHADIDYQTMPGGSVVGTFTSAYILSGADRYDLSGGSIQKFAAGANYTFVGQDSDAPDPNNPFSGYLVGINASPQPPIGPTGQNGRLVGYKVALTSSTIPGIPAGIFNADIDYQTMPGGSVVGTFTSAYVISGADRYDLSGGSIQKFAAGANYTFVGQDSDAPDPNNPFSGYLVGINASLIPQPPIPNTGGPMGSPLFFKPIILRYTAADGSEVYGYTNGMGALTLVDIQTLRSLFGSKVDELFSTPDGYDQANGITFKYESVDPLGSPTMPIIQSFFSQPPAIADLLASSDANKDNLMLDEATGKITGGYATLPDGTKMLFGSDGMIAYIESEWTVGNTKTKTKTDYSMALLDPNSQMLTGGTITIASETQREDGTTASVKIDTYGTNGITTSVTHYYDSDGTTLLNTVTAEKSSLDPGSIVVNTTGSNGSTLGTTTISLDPNQDGLNNEADIRMMQMMMGGADSPVTTQGSVECADGRNCFDLGDQSFDKPEQGMTGFTSFDAGNIGANSATLTFTIQNYPANGSLMVTMNTNREQKPDQNFVFIYDPARSAAAPEVQNHDPVIDYTYHLDSSNVVVTTDPATGLSTVRLTIPPVLSPDTTYLAGASGINSGDHNATYYPGNAQGGVFNIAFTTASGSEPTGLPTIPDADDNTKPQEKSFFPAPNYQGVLQFPVFHFAVESGTYSGVQSGAEFEGYGANFFIVNSLNVEGTFASAVITNPDGTVINLENVHVYPAGFSIDWVPPAAGVAIGVSRVDGVNDPSPFPGGFQIFGTPSTRSSGGSDSEQGMFGAKAGEGPDEKDAENTAATTDTDTETTTNQQENTGSGVENQNPNGDVEAGTSAPLMPGQNQSFQLVSYYTQHHSYENSTRLIVTLSGVNSAAVVLTISHNQAPLPGFDGLYLTAMGNNQYYIDLPDGALPNGYLDCTVSITTNDVKNFQIFMDAGYDEAKNLNDSDVTDGDRANDFIKGNEGSNDNTLTDGVTGDLPGDDRNPYIDPILDNTPEGDNNEASTGPDGGNGIAGDRNGDGVVDDYDDPDYIASHGTTLPNTAEYYAKMHGVVAYFVQRFTDLTGAPHNGFIGYIEYIRQQILSYEDIDDYGPDDFYTVFERVYYYPQDVDSNGRFTVDPLRGLNDTPPDYGQNLTFENYANLNGLPDNNPLKEFIAYNVLGKVNRGTFTMDVRAVISPDNLPATHKLYDVEVTILSTGEIVHYMVEQTELEDRAVPGRWITGYRLYNAEGSGSNPSVTGLMGAGDLRNNGDGSSLVGAAGSDGADVDTTQGGELLRGALGDDAVINTWGPSQTEDQRKLDALNNIVFQQASTCDANFVTSTGGCVENLNQDMASSSLVVYGDADFDQAVVDDLMARASDITTMNLPSDSAILAYHLRKNDSGDVLQAGFIVVTRDIFQLLNDEGLLPRTISSGGGTTSGGGMPTTGGGTTTIGDAGTVSGDETGIDLPWDTNGNGIADADDEINSDGSPIGDIPGGTTDDTTGVSAAGPWDTNGNGIADADDEVNDGGTPSSDDTTSDDGPVSDDSNNPGGDRNGDGVVDQNDENFVKNGDTEDDAQNVLDDRNKDGVIDDKDSMMGGTPTQSPSQMAALAAFIKKNEATLILNEEGRIVGGYGFLGKSKITFGSDGSPVKMETLLEDGRVSIEDYSNVAFSADNPFLPDSGLVREVVERPDGTISRKTETSVNLGIAQTVETSYYDASGALLGTTEAINNLEDGTLAVLVSAPDGTTLAAATFVVTMAGTLIPVDNEADKLIRAFQDLGADMQFILPLPSHPLFPIVDRNTVSRIDLAAFISQNESTLILNEAGEIVGGKGSFGYSEFEFGPDGSAFMKTSLPDGRVSAADLSSVVFSANNPFLPDSGVIKEVVNRPDGTIARETETNIKDGVIQSVDTLYYDLNGALRGTSIAVNNPDDGILTITVAAPDGSVLAETGFLVMVGGNLTPLNQDEAKILTEILLNLTAVIQKGSGELRRTDEDEVLELWSVSGGAVDEFGKPYQAPRLIGILLDPNGIVGPDTAIGLMNFEYTEDQDENKILTSLGDFFAPPPSMDRGGDKKGGTPEQAAYQLSLLSLWVPLNESLAKKSLNETIADRMNLSEGTEIEVTGKVDLGYSLNGQHQLWISWILEGTQYAGIVHTDDEGHFVLGEFGVEGNLQQPEFGLQERPIFDRIDLETVNNGPEDFADLVISFLQKYPLMPGFDPVNWSVSVDVTIGSVTNKDASGTHRTDVFTAQVSQCPKFGDGPCQLALFKGVGEDLRIAHSYPGVPISSMRIDVTGGGYDYIPGVPTVNPDFVDNPKNDFDGPSQFFIGPKSKLPFGLNVVYPEGEGIGSDEDPLVAYVIPYSSSTTPGAVARIAAIQLVTDEMGNSRIHVYSTIEGPNSDPDSPVGQAFSRNPDAAAFSIPEGMTKEDIDFFVNGSPVVWDSGGVVYSRDWFDEINTSDLRFGNAEVRKRGITRLSLGTQDAGSVQIFYLDDSSAERSLTVNIQDGLRFFAQPGTALPADNKLTVGSWGDFYLDLPENIRILGFENIEAAEDVWANYLSQKGFIAFHLNSQRNDENENPIYRQYHVADVIDIQGAEFYGFLTADTSIDGFGEPSLDQDPVRFPGGESLDMAPKYLTLLRHVLNGGSPEDQIDYPGELSISWNDSNSNPDYTFSNPFTLTFTNLQGEEITETVVAAKEAVTGNIFFAFQDGDSEILRTLTQSPRAGDVDQDGQITNSDVNLIRQSLGENFGIRALNTTDLETSDIISLPNFPSPESVIAVLALPDGSMAAVFMHELDAVVNGAVNGLFGIVYLNGEGDVIHTELAAGESIGGAYYITDSERPGGIPKFGINFDPAEGMSIFIDIRPDGANLTDDHVRLGGTSDGEVTLYGIKASPSEVDDNVEPRKTLGDQINEYLENEGIIDFHLNGEEAGVSKVIDFARPTDDGFYALERAGFSTDFEGQLVVNLSNLESGLALTGKYIGLLHNRVENNGMATDEIDASLDDLGFVFEDGLSQVVNFSYAINGNQLEVYVQARKNGDTIEVKLLTAEEVEAMRADADAAADAEFEAQKQAVLDDLTDRQSQVEQAISDLKDKINSEYVNLEGILEEALNASDALQGRLGAGLDALKQLLGEYGNKEAEDFLAEAQQAFSEYASRADAYLAFVWAAGTPELNEAVYIDLPQLEAKLNAITKAVDIVTFANVGDDLNALSDYAQYYVEPETGLPAQQEVENPAVKFADLADQIESFIQQVSDEKQKYTDIKADLIGRMDSALAEVSSKLEQINADIERITTEKGSVAQDFYDQKNSAISGFSELVANLSEMAGWSFISADQRDAILEYQNLARDLSADWASVSEADFIQSYIAAFTARLQKDRSYYEGLKAEMTAYKENVQAAQDLAALRALGVPPEDTPRLDDPEKVSIPSLEEYGPGVADSKDVTELINTLLSLQTDFDNQREAKIAELKDLIEANQTEINTLKVTIAQDEAAAGENARAAYAEAKAPVDSLTGVVAQIAALKTDPNIAGNKALLTAIAKLEKASAAAAAAVPDLAVYSNAILEQAVGQDRNELQARIAYGEALQQFLDSFEPATFEDMDVSPADLDVPDYQYVSIPAFPDVSGVSKDADDLLVVIRDTIKKFTDARDAKLSDFRNKLLDIAGQKSAAETELAQAREAAEAAANALFDAAEADIAQYNNQQERLEQSVEQGLLSASLENRIATLGIKGEEIKAAVENLNREEFRARYVKAVTASLEGKVKSLTDYLAALKSAEARTLQARTLTDLKKILFPKQIMSTAKNMPAPKLPKTSTIAKSAADLVTAVTKYWQGYKPRVSKPTIYAQTPVKITIPLINAAQYVEVVGDLPEGVALSGNDFTINASTAGSLKWTYKVKIRTPFGEFETGSYELSVKVRLPKK